MSPQQEEDVPSIRTTSKQLKKAPLVAAVACEPCRKRKVRCSGEAPCSICQRQMVDCYFDYHRRRRGPRTKKKASTTDPLVETGSSNQEATAPVNDVPDGVVSVVAKPKHIIAMSSMESLRKGLGTIMGVTIGKTYTLFPANCIQVSVDLVIHLILIYCTTVNTQQSPVLSSRRFLRLLEAGECSRSLCHAMCAASVRYSRNRLVKKANPNLAERFLQDSRQALRQSPPTQGALDRAQSLAVLSMYESAAGAGFQAWCDINAASSLIVDITGNDTNSPDVVESIDMIRRHAAVAEIFPTLGHRRLTIHRSFTLHLPGDRFNMDGVAPNITVVLLSLFEIVLRVHNLVQVDFTKQSPAPWSPVSEFTSIKRELDILRVRYNSEISFTEESFLHFLADENGAGEYLMCSLTWHYCVILLNRVFLPIRIHLSNENAQTEAPSSGSTIKKVYFPAGPKSFLRERATACYASAKSIVNICDQVLSNDPLMLPPFMGYCCFQGGLALIDQLYSRDSTNLPDVIESLKTTFTIVGAMGSYFTPAQSWVDALFKAHTEDKIVKTPSLSISSIFSHYFARFSGLEEPPFIPLEKLHEIPCAGPCTPEAQTTPEAEKSAALSAGKEVEIQQAQPEARSWISDYQRNLLENITMLKKSSGDMSQEPHPSTSNNQASSSVPQLQGEVSHAPVAQNPLVPQPVPRHQEEEGSIYTSEGSDSFYDGAENMAFPLQDEVVYPNETFMQDGLVPNMPHAFGSLDFWDMDIFTHINMDTSLALASQTAPNSGERIVEGTSL